jgi:hypothetical protein
MKFVLHTSIWGKTHINYFLTYAIPSILGQLGFEELEKKYQYQYNIFTTSEDQKIITTNINFIKLQKKMLIKLNTNVLDNFIVENKNYVELNNLGIIETFKEVVKNDSAFCWIIPDCIYANNLFIKIAQCYENKKRMLIAPSHTRCCKNILKDIKINFLDVDKNISIDSQALTRLSFKNIVKKSANQNFYNYYNPSTNHTIYYKFGENYVCHMPAPNPIFIYPENKNAKFKFKGLSFEGTDYLEELVPNFSDIEIIRDTSILNCVAVETEELDKANLQVINKKIKYNIFKRPLLINFIYYLIKNKHSKLSIKYYEIPILHKIDEETSSKIIKKIGEEKPTLFIKKVISAYSKASNNVIFKIYIIISYNIFRLLYRFRRKFFLNKDARIS